MHRATPTLAGEFPSWKPFIALGLALASALSSNRAHLFLRRAATFAADPRAGCDPAAGRWRGPAVDGEAGAARKLAGPRRQYAARAGVESTHEQTIRRCGLRQCRYIGLAKTHLQHVVTATAINLIWVGQWLTGTPMAPTRCSHFAALQGTTV